ncbi:MAG: hypothetical protein RBS99_15620 [Rhodospirillales bacterium]|jgi:hypothetical protein|nr:hypothetical protein [Rhodospirillales bacterium]
MIAMPFRVRRIGLAGLLSLSLAACATVPVPGQAVSVVPGDPGIYAVAEGGGYVRLDGDRDWERQTWAKRSVFGRGTQFVVADPSFRSVEGRLDEAVRLYRVAWVRSRIGRDGRIMPTTDGRWSVSESESFRVAADVSRVEGRDDAVRLVPETALGDGLYSIHYAVGAGKPRAARVGINWATLDRDRYASGNCVDQYLDGEGRPLGYRLCEEQPLLGTGGLLVFLVPPRVEINDDIERLIVQGIVVNTSERNVQIPALVATIQGGNGSTIKEWTFKADKSALRPHDNAPFEIALDNPPPATKTVRVEFSSQTTAAVR